MDGVNVYRYGYFLRPLERLSYDGGILPKLKANPLYFGLVPFLLAGQIRAIRARLRARDYEFVHAHWIIPQAFCACIGRGSGRTPVLVTSHGGDLFGLRAAPFRWLKSWTLKRCDEVAVVSRYMQDVVVADHGLQRERVHVLPMGVDLSQRFSASGNASRDKGRIVFVGRLVGKKGVRHLIDAVSELKEQLPDVQLDIIGDGPLRESLESRARDHGLAESIRFHGALPQDRIPQFLQSAEVAVVPSVIDESGDQEGLGLVTIEAMGCGCPVVASDLPAIRDVVEHGRTGLLATPGDPADLALHIARLMMDSGQARELASNAAAFVRERFDWERTADAYARVLSL